QHVGDTGFQQARRQLCQLLRVAQVARDVSEVLLRHALDPGAGGWSVGQQQAGAQASIGPRQLLAVRAQGAGDDDKLARAHVGVARAAARWPNSPRLSRLCARAPFSMSWIMSISMAVTGAVRPCSSATRPISPIWSSISVLRLRTARSRQTPLRCLSE